MLASSVAASPQHLAALTKASSSRFMQAGNASCEPAAASGEAVAFTAYTDCFGVLGPIAVKKHSLPVLEGCDVGRCSRLPLHEPLA